MTKKNFQAVREIVARCQTAAILAEGDPDLAAVGVWELVHGFILLIQEGQISHSLTEQYSLREMLLATLNQVSRVGIDMMELVGSSNGEQRGSIRRLHQDYPEWIL